MTLLLDKPTPAATQPIAPNDARSGRLASLDVFRGLVILAMLIVNNIGDAGTVGYFWKHADWEARPLIESLRAWWPHFQAAGLSALFDAPPLRNCTLADFVMPMFMLIIGAAIPFSAAAALRRNIVGTRYWLGIVRRGATLYLLGWCIDCSLAMLNWRLHGGATPLTLTLGMNVLQLLGVSFVIARIAYGLPAVPRLILAGILYLAHWAMLRFVPQGAVPAGTFTDAHNSPGYLYGTLAIFRTVNLLPGLKFNVVGMLSVPPAVATMILGTWIGDTLRNSRLTPRSRVARLICFGITLALLGLAWSCDLPMNKPRWTPCYLVYCAGIGSILLALLYALIDAGGYRGWITPLVALGSNAIGIYFLSIMAKIWLLNLPATFIPKLRGHYFTDYLVTALQRVTTPAVGSWLFTIWFIAAVWLAALIAQRKRWIWKV